MYLHLMCKHAGVEVYLLEEGNYDSVFFPVDDWRAFTPWKPDNQFTREMGKFVGGLGQLEGFYYSDRRGAMGEVIPFFADCARSSPEKLHLEDGEIEWGVQKPTEIDEERIFAIRGAVMSWPDKNLILFGLGRTCAIDVIQAGTHLGGCLLPDFSKTFKEFPPPPEGFHRPVVLKSWDIPKISGNLNLEMLIEGFFGKWIEWVSRHFFRGNECLRVSYGEDPIGFHFFRGVSEYHIRYLAQKGCFRYCKSQPRRG